MTSLEPNSLPACRTYNSDSSTVVDGPNNYTSESSGENNTVLGLDSLSACTTGTGNTAVGVGALTAVVTGGNNTAVGFQACNTTSMNSCTAVGTYAGTSCVGCNHTVIGFQSSCTCNVNGTVIGSGSLLSKNNCILLGNDSTTSLVAPLHAYDPTAPLPDLAKNP